MALSMNERNSLRQSILDQQDDHRRYPEGSRFPPQIFEGFSRLRRAFEAGDKREAERARNDIGLTVKAVEFAKSVFAELPAYDAALSAAKAEQGRCHEMQAELAAIERKRVQQGFLSAHDAERYLSVEKRFLAANNNLNLLLTATPRRAIGELWAEHLEVNSMRWFLVRGGTFNCGAAIHNRLLQAGVNPQKGRWTSIGLKASDRRWWESSDEHKARIETLKNAKPAFADWMPVPAQPQHRTPRVPNLGGMY